jgi:hypothetical protein
VDRVQLDAFRERADRFIAEQDEEFYLHYAGLKERLELEPIYERYADLTTLEQAQQIGGAVDGDPGVRELWRFACEGYMGNLSKTFAEKIAELEATLEVTVDGESLPFRMLRPVMANSEDRDRRKRLYDAAAELTEEHLNPVYLEGTAVAHDAARTLGGGTYRDLYVERFGWRLEELAAQCRAFLESTERLWEDEGDRLFRERVGIGLDEAEGWDTPRLFKGVAWEEYFPADRLLPALRRTLGDMGIDLDSQQNVHIDAEDRPTKDPRAFCSPIEVPEKVMLVIKPIGGPDDYRAFFHEAGHAEHFANTSPELRVEEKRLGDNAVTEGWAMLLQHITDDTRWLSRMLDFPQPREYAREGAVNLLYFVRRYAAKLLYELEFHATEDVPALRTRYVELLGDALKISPSPSNYLADIDAGYYVSSYIRSWAFEAQLREYLRTRYGHEWFASPKAGAELLDLWSQGQRLGAEDLLKQVTGEELELEAVAERVREGLAV